ncbi:MAG: hypothetical protein EXQ57_00815 [Bryobacterales bacterium]|nr:hypothetical protein [Bryobacterales bacterium]
MQRSVLCSMWFACLLFAPAIHAQTQMACTASAPTPATMRSAGMTELAGDLILTCRGGTPAVAGAFPLVNISIFFNAAVSSRVTVAASGTTPPQTEAILIVDTPLAVDQKPCLTNPCLNTDNLFQGRYDSFNSLSWINIPVNPPGPNADRVLRIRNIRMNTTSIPPTGGPALAFVSISGTQVSSTLANPQQTLGTVRAGVSYEIRSALDGALTGPISLTACNAYNIDLASTPGAAAYSSPGGRTMLVKFTEGFPNAFKRRNLGTTLTEPQIAFSQDNPGISYNTESGFNSTVFPGVNGWNRVGVADSGTTLRAVFTNIPAGARVYVGTREFATGSSLDAGGIPTTKARLTSTPGAPFVAAAPDNTIDGGLKLVPSTGEISWEVLETDVNSGESVAFVVVIAYGNNPQPAASTISTSGGFGPQSLAVTATAGDAIPRFLGLTGPTPMVALNVCRTTLLFQFITNQAGFDTGLAVSNTSRDTLTTAPQTGRCTATFYPTPFNAATQAQFPILSSPTLAGGEQWTFTLSGSRAGFQGYMMVGCDFQFAHGYAFISDFGSKNLAQGYQALVIPDRARLADPMTTAPAGSGEQLIH